MSALRALLVVFLAALAAAPGAHAQTGQQKYTQWCQGCHNFPGNNHNNVLGGKDWNYIKLAMDTVPAMTGELRPAYDAGLLTDDDFMLIAGYLQTFAGGVTRQLAMPAAVDFGPVAVGAVSATVTREITSIGNATVQLASTVASSNPAEFSIVSTTCTAGASVPPNGTCSVTLQFTPAATGARGGQVDVVSNGIGSPQSFGLSGIGASAPTVVPVVEYFHAGFGHYFMTADADEIAGLDAGAYDFAFVRTGRQFNAYGSPAAGTVPVCRFFTVTFAPKSSHFYTGDPVECDGVKLNPDWQFEKIAFHIAMPVGGACPIGTAPVYRMYNNGQTGAPNHRFANDILIYQDFTTTRNWAPEGIGFCAPP